MRTVARWFHSGAWNVTWDYPESALGPADVTSGTTTYTQKGPATFEAVSALENGAGTYTVTETFDYQRDAKTLTRRVVDSRGFTYTQKGTVNGDLGGQFTIRLDGEPFTVKGQTVRLLVTNTQTLTQRRAVIERFMKAYRETIEWMYSNDPKALQTYADFVGIPVAQAKRTRDDFFPKASVDPDRIVGLDLIVQDAVQLKYTAAPLTKEQLAELIRIPPRQ